MHCTTAISLEMSDEPKTSLWYFRKCRNRKVEVCPHRGILPDDILAGIHFRNSVQEMQAEENKQNRNLFPKIFLFQTVMSLYKIQKHVHLYCKTLP